MLSYTLIFSLACLIALLPGVMLLRAGERTGDGRDDLLITRVMPALDFSSVLVTVRNSSDIPVLVGLSLRGRTLRLWAEGGVYVSAPRRNAKRPTLATRQTTVGVVDATQTATLVVPGAPKHINKGQLMVTVGQRDRLRVVHRRLDASGCRPFGRHYQ